MGRYRKEGIGEGEKVMREGKKREGEERREGKGEGRTSTRKGGG